MKQFTSLMLSKIFYAVYFFSMLVNAQGINSESVLVEPSWQENLKQVWENDIQFHGFLSQGLFHSTGNNVYGHSKNSVSAGLTEMGLNVSYQALDSLSFAVQGLYRRAGESTGDWGEVSLDFAFFDYAFFRHSKGSIGVRGGRVKNPWGLYNETRDVSFTHPTIFLPLIYFDRSRTLFLAMDGGQFYTDYNTAIGDFTFKFNYGLMNADDDELLMAIVNAPNVSGKLVSKPSFITQLSYEIMGGQYIFALSYADVKLGYSSPRSVDPYLGLEANFNSFILSAQYNGEKFSFAGEYNRQWNAFTGIQHFRPDLANISERWYVQGGYRIIENVELTVRYDSAVRDIKDKQGHKFSQVTGLPAHLMFTREFVFGLRWDITPAWMIRGEYHRVNGTANISFLDNPNLTEADRHWNIYALQASFRF